MKIHRFISKSILTIICLSLLVVIGCKPKLSDDNPGANSVPDPGKVPNPEWISLFDGNSLTGWKRFNADDIGSMWKVENGTIACYSEGGEEASRDGGSLITIEKFDNFEFRVDWKISKEGNSGILYHIVEDPTYRYAYETGPEYQLLDDAGWPGTLNDDQKTGSNYDMYAAPLDKKLNPPGSWNNSRIIYNQGHVEHWLNGQKLLEFEEGSEEWIQRRDNSKWGEYPDWCKSKTGSIGLQDHGSPIWFRNIQVKRL